MRLRGAFTLAEMMLVVGLLGVLYTILMFTVIQVGQVSRRASLAANAQLELMRASEQLRWQLRCLYSQTDPQPETDSSGNTTSNVTNTATTRAGMVGVAGSALWGQRGQGEGRDILLFITTNPKGRSGVVEVGYKLSEDGRTLLYRQFPYRDVNGFHSALDQVDAPWNPLLKEVKQFSVDYSRDGLVWQRDWDASEVPRRIRIHLERSSGEVIDFQITPILGAGRW